MDHFMLDVIKNDFGVSLLKYDSDHALFAAFRKGGTERIRTNIGLWESNIVGVWHFVEHVQTNNQTPIKRFEIKQTIPLVKLYTPKLGAIKYCLAYLKKSFFQEALAPQHTFSSRL